METKSRVKNSIKNTMYGLICQLISLSLSFIVRTFFIMYLGEEYLGVNGLFLNILTVLSLAELGFGPAMVYSMYKPLADNDTEKINSLMKLYLKVYSIIGIVVAISGIIIIPFMDYIIKDMPDIDNLTTIYILFLVNSVISYFYAYKRSILEADQKSYILSRYRYIFTITKSIFQISILIYTKNYILFLLLQIAATFLENVVISIKVNKTYKFLNYKNAKSLEKKDYKRIKEDVKALVLAKFGYVMLNGTDNILISSFVGVIWVARLSNYLLISGAIVMIVSQVFNGLTASVGNFIVKEDRTKQYDLFKLLDLLNFWLYGFATICLIILLNPFIQLWIGKKFLLSELSVIVFSINFYINGTMSFLWVFRSTMGLFVHGKFRPIIAALLNIALSIILSRNLALLGILLGTTISRLLVNLWYDPYIIFKHGLKRSAVTYYLRYFGRVTLLSIISVAIFFIKKILFINGITVLLFIVLIVICFIIPNMVFIFINCKSPEFKRLLSLLMPIINRIRKRWGDYSV